MFAGRFAGRFAGMFAGANVMSRLADRIGRRQVFMINLGSYSVLSIIAAFSPDLTFVVVVRFLTGVGIGAYLVLVEDYLAEFLPGRVRGRYISWAYVVGFLGVPVAALIGPEPSRSTSYSVWTAGEGCSSPAVSAPCSSC